MIFLRSSSSFLGNWLGWYGFAREAVFPACLFFALSLPSSCCFIWHCRMGWAVEPIFCGDPSPTLEECHTTTGRLSVPVFKFSQRPVAAEKSCELTRHERAQFFNRQKNLWNIFCSLHERSGILFYMKRVKSPFSGVSVDCTTDKRWQFHSRGSI